MILLRSSRLFLLLFIGIFLVACGQPKATSGAAQKPEPAPAGPPTAAPNLPNNQQPSGPASQFSPQSETANTGEPAPAPLAVRNGKDRVLLDYYSYLTEKEGLKLGPAREMAPQVFHAEDVIQFTVDEPKAAVLVARFSSDEDQARGNTSLNMLTKDGRILLSTGLYSIVIKGGDDKLQSKLKNGLESFEKK